MMALLISLVIILKSFFFTECESQIKITQPKPAQFVNSFCGVGVEFWSNDARVLGSIPGPRWLFRKVLNKLICINKIGLLEPGVQKWWSRDAQIRVNFFLFFFKTVQNNFWVKNLSFWGIFFCQIMNPLKINLVNYRIGN